MRKWWTSLFPDICSVAGYVRVYMILASPEKGNAMKSLLLSAALLLFPMMSQARTLEVVVDVSDQTMQVIENGKVLHEWPVSTARRGKVTPRGEFSPYWLSKNHRSSLYNNAPMPFAIFYSGNYAIHGTNEISKLGTPASAGCVRLSPENASKLFEHVETYGKASLRIRIKD